LGIISSTCRRVARCRPWVPASTPGKVASRRKFFGRAVGVTAAVLTARTGLSAFLAAPARAASNSMALAESTTVEPGAVGPAVVQLTDTATIAVDASLGNDFRVTLGGSRTMSNPVNAVNGQQIIFQITQGSLGSATITWGSSYLFSSALPQPSLSTSPGQTDLLGFIYSAATSSWLLVAFVNGFS
jgi:hypothetical protein